MLQKEVKRQVQPPAVSVTCPTLLYDWPIRVETLSFQPIRSWASTSFSGLRVSLLPDPGARERREEERPWERDCLSHGNDSHAYSRACRNLVFLLCVVIGIGFLGCDWLATSWLVHREKIGQFFQVHHSQSPQWCFSTLINCYFEAFFNLKVILHFAKMTSIFL